jgi:alkanesulfonate monooxygenase
VPIEFLGIAATNDGSETTPRSGLSFDRDYTLRLGLAHEDFGWDRVLFAHRPNVSYPTFAAKTFATLDQIGDGRLTVHFIDVGRYVLPLVREEVAERDAARGTAAGAARGAGVAVPA